MKDKIYIFDWLRVAILVLLLANLLLLAGQPVSAAPLMYTHSDKWLFDQARYYISRNNGLMAAEYLRAFIEREPALLANTKWKSYVESKLAEVESQINRQVGYGQEVEASLAKCGRYDCANAQYRTTQSTKPISSNTMLYPLPDEVIFYDQPGCSGNWVVKSIGTYNNESQIGLPNDSIIGFWPGGGVTVTMCMHGGMTGDCETFDKTNCDLTNHWLGYNVTSLRINSR